jgi:DNA-binding CsgD family transcriptional regulator
VLGPDTPIQLAAKVASLAVDEALVAADRLTAAAIMRPGQPLSFIHPLIATAVNGDLSASERTLLNRRAADALAAQGGPVEAIAPHLLWTPPAGDPRTIATLRAAADHARLAGSPQTAAQYLERALLEPAPTDGERAELLIELGRAEVGTAPERAGAHLRQAIALGANEPAAARLALELGRALYVAGKHEEAARTFLSASERVPVEEPLRDELRAWLASASIFVEPLREIGQQITLELASAPPAEPTVGQRAILALAGAGLVISGAPHRDAARFAKLAWADGAQLAAETCDGYTWMHVTAVHLWSGHPMAGLPIIEAVIADARLRGSVMAFATASFIKAGAEFFLGQLQDALADLEQVMLIHRRDGWNMFIGTAVAQHVEVLLEVGDLSAARSALTTLDPARFGDSAEGAALRYAAGLVAQAQGSTAAAAAAFDTAIEMLARTQFRAIRLVPAWRAAGLAHLALGNRGRAAALVAEGEQIARNAEVHDMVAAMLLVRARLEDDAVATTTLREAVELAGASDSRLEHARALIALGSHLRRTNQRRAAQQPLLDGLELAAGCGAAPLEAAARQELAVLGSRPRRAARSGAEALTASELRVARLAAGGLTNRAIAEALFVTPKTIEYHLRNAYMKLDVSSRKELAAALS